MEIERKLEEDKRQDYTKIRIQDLKLKKQKNENEQMLQIKDIEEAKKLIQDYSFKELEREKAYRDM
jgi:hypothetical protein